ncbi:MAG: hypothetical protein ACE5DN_06985 [Flavobacteriales bacterium]
MEVKVIKINQTASAACELFWGVIGLAVMCMWFSTLLDDKILNLHVVIGMNKSVCIFTGRFSINMQLKYT